MVMEVAVPILGIYDRLTAHI